LQASERERRALELELSRRRLGAPPAPLLPAAPLVLQASAAAPNDSASVEALIQALIARGVLPQNAAAMALSSPAPAAAAVAAAPPPQPESAAPGPMRFPPQTIQQMLVAFKAELWAFLAANNLFFPAHMKPPATPLAATVPPVLLPQLIDLVKMGLELAKQVLHVSGQDAHLLLHDGSLTTHPCAADEATRWRGVVGAVAPTRTQILQITAMRNSLISMLERSYTARMELKTAGFQSLGTVPETGAPRWAEEILLHAAANSGYGLLAQANAELYTCVENLKISVEEDRQCIEAALSQLLLNILDPLQAAKYLAKSHPFSWNILSFVNIVVAGAS
jgi:hypothetical protein